MDCKHDWKRPHWVVGGSRRRPGEWGRGSPVATVREACQCCGLVRVTRTRWDGYVVSVEYVDDDSRALEWAAAMARS